MLSVSSYSIFKGIPVMECFGSGLHVYEVLVQQGTTVGKFWINANATRDAINFFCRRFNVTLEGRSLPQVAGSCYRLNTSGKGYLYEDAILRKIY